MISAASVATKRIAMSKHNQTSSRTKVMAADDDPITRSLIKSKLSELNCDVVEAADGADAWTVLGEDKYDLAIIDLHMPNIDGFTLIQCIRGHPRTKHMPVLVLTSRKDSDAVQSAFEAGATSFLIKPLQWSTFVSHIEYLMRLNQEASKSRINAQRVFAEVQVRDALMFRVAQMSSDAASQISAEIRAMLCAKELPSTFEELEERLASISKHVKGLEALQTRAHNKTLELSSLLADGDELVRLDHVLGQANDRMELNATRRGVSIKTTYSRNDLLIFCNGDAVRMAIEELVLNAVNVSKSGSSILIEARKHEDCMLSISVSDSGDGMMPGEVSELLSPGTGGDVLIDGSAAPFGGVGLPIAKAIAEAYGGKLEVRSMPGSGTTAMFIVPADRVLTEAEAAA